ncbi:hypothetical protein VSH64_03285 [Amycolatopsis rhabdoformis]|uniref:Uncharacterized protein n=1 Tax=Amycolatopsis rhabdoformis TaxID=1448059 RepID=A0ABZ1IB38_9PSEU|nr:hypothetical protein [Amycolatopsis rhabdoformis]WSE31142.1 hypothetical protein VSH64_03285 [Amycolatopsis rhabdoformis]
MNDRWTLVLPEGLDDFAWAEAEVRGVLLHVELDHAGRRYPAIVYDPYRIVQDADLVTESAPFYEANVVLVPEVTRDAVARAADRLARGGEPDWLPPRAPEPESSWTLDVANGAEVVDWARVGERGALSASLRYGERRFPITFHDLRRLAEAVGWDDLDHLESRRGDPRPVEFAGKNFIVLAELTRDAAEQAVAELGRRGEFAWLLD